MKKKIKWKQVIGYGLLLVAVGGICDYLGANHVVETLIHNAENGKEPILVQSLDPNLGDLFYEISATCVGD